MRGPHTTLRRIVARAKLAAYLKTPTLLLLLENPARKEVRQ